MGHGGTAPHHHPLIDGLQWSVQKGRVERRAWTLAAVLDSWANERTGRARRPEPSEHTRVANLLNPVFGRLA
eukprot:scaffold770_cov362-Pavlova_lutheri.AAC.8